MLVKLHDRRCDARRSRGLSCDADGLYFAGDCALIAGAWKDGQRVYRRRSIETINRLLSVGYGAPVDLSPHDNALDQITDLLWRGDYARAQIAALKLRLPDLPGEADIDRLLKADQLLRFNPTMMRSAASPRRRAPAHLGTDAISTRRQAASASAPRPAWAPSRSKTPARLSTMGSPKI